MKRDIRAHRPEEPDDRPSSRNHTWIRAKLNGLAVDRIDMSVSIEEHGALERSLMGKV